jgi:hypothetical protein
MSLTIVVSHYKENLDWLKKSKFPIILVDKVGSDSSWLEPSYIVEKNLAKEDTSYLKYIIENYDNLPDHVAFIHGHETALHQCFSRPLLEVIENANISKYDFISLNNVVRFYNFINEPEKKFTQNVEMWDIYEFPWEKPKIGENILATPHGQFIVSKKAILRNPKSLYQRWYDIIFEKDGGRYPLGSPQEDWTTYNTETFFEMFFHYIFGEPLICRIMPDWFLFDPPEPVRVWAPYGYQEKDPQYLVFK